ncbi:MAG: transposase [Alteromonadaceae bacterium]|nr:transposase [Alteromonadaceae bacterium]
MKNRRFTEAQIFAILKEGKSGAMIVPDLCRKYGVGQSTYYKWKSQYGGMEASDLAKLKALEDENHKLKKMFADVSLQNMALKDVLEKKL